MVMKFMVLLLALSCFYSCSSDKKKTLEELDVEFVERITEFPDSSFFSDIRMMEYDNGKIYLLEPKRGELVSLTEDFKQLNIEAPHSEIDLMMPASFNVVNDTAYIFDYGSVRTLKMYAGGKQIRSMSSLRFKDKRMAVGNSYIWASAPTDTSCYLRVCKQNPDEFILAGKVQKEDNKKRTMLKNSKHLFLVDDEALYAVPDSYAYIEKYNAETGALEERLDLSSVPFIKGNIQYAESQSVANNSYFIYVMDACLYKDALFLLCPSLGEPYRCNLLLKIDVDGNKMQLAGYYELPGNVYRSICVSDEHLFAAYNGRDCAIEKYKLNDN